jgi:thiol:disulfide interchange protein DsbC
VKFLRFAVVLSCLFVVFPVSLQADELSDLKAQLEQRIGDLKIRELKPSPIPGLLEMVYDTSVGYVSADGRYLIINGQMVELESGRNLTAARRKGLILEAVEAVGEKNMVVFAPKKTLRTVTVFTDVDCQYCARLHQEVPALNRAGIKVRYLLYPRAGIGSESAKRIESVWCAKDRQKAMTTVKSGGKIELKSCANPIKEHLQLGQLLAINGTPALVLDDGRVIPGYAPAPALLNELGIKDEKGGEAK